MTSVLRLRLASALAIGAVAVVLPFLIMSTHGHHKVVLSGTVHFWAIWPAAAAATAAAVVLTIAGARAIELLHGETGSAFAAVCVGALERVLARDITPSLGIAV